MTHPVVAALRSGAAEARREACETAAADPSAVLLVDALVDALGDDDARVARAASHALQRIGREHDTVLTSLRAALRGESARQRLEAAWTWARLEPPPIKLLPAVVSTLDALAGDARWRAARLLVELGRLHAEIVPVVRDLASPAQTPRVRRIGLAVLRDLDPHGDETRRMHLEASRAADPGLQRLALTGLAGLGAATDEVWSRLVEVMAEHPDPGCRRVAATAIGALGAPPASALRALCAAADSDDDAGVRAAATRAAAALEAQKSQ